MAAERIQKLLSRAGIASRRQAEAWMAAGRVTVNGQRVGLGAKADPAVDVIAIDGRPLTDLPARLARKRYVMLHKPAGVITTLRDPQGRPSVGDLCRRFGLEGLHPVGRLDRDSEGLLLLTDDGALTLALTHPRHRVDKVYRVQVTGAVAGHQLRQLEQGVVLDDGQAHAVRARLIRRLADGAWIEVVLREGRKRQVRRMCAAVGWDVRRLIRVAIGPVRLGNLPPGRWRPLHRDEVEALLRCTGQVPTP